MITTDPSNNLNQEAYDTRRAPVLVLVEGQNDIDFLRGISSVLHEEGLRVPDLATLERRGELVFIPMGGGDLGNWTHRLAPLGLLEFHLYDREQPPETDIRRKFVDEVNLRPNCQAALTTKRSIENYLHPSAIQEALGTLLDFDDDSPVAELLARNCHERVFRSAPWDLLPRRARKRFVHHAKHWLNTRAVACMTAARLMERDPHGEVLSWLATIRAMTEGALASTAIGLSERELATMLAALRSWQRSPLDPAGFPQLDEREPLTVEEIDSLCERLNR